MARHTPEEDSPFSPIEPVSQIEPPGGSLGAAPLPPPPPAPAPSSVPPSTQRSASAPQPSHALETQSVSQGPPDEPHPQRSGLLIASLIINCIVLPALIIGAFLYLRQNIVTAQNVRASEVNARNAEDLAAEVTRLTDLNESLTNSLAAARKSIDAGTASALEQHRDVIAGAAGDLSTCSAAIHEVSDRLVELIGADPAGAGATVSTILQRCELIATRTTKAVETLNG